MFLTFDNLTYLGINNNMLIITWKLNFREGGGTWDKDNTDKTGQHWVEAWKIGTINIVWIVLL